MSADYLQSVTVGERPPLNRTIELLPYDPLWPRQFDELAALV